MDKQITLIMLYVDIVIMILLAIDVYISYQNLAMRRG